MADPLVKVEGARQLRKTLREAGDDLTELRDVHSQVATIVTRAGQGNAPVGPSGRLASSVRGSGTKTAAIVRAGRKAIPYAGPIHWGWPSRPNPARGIRGGPIMANPFLTAGAQATEPQWINTYLEAVDTALDKFKGI